MPPNAQEKKVTIDVMVTPPPVLQELQRRRLETEEATRPPTTKQGARKGARTPQSEQPFSRPPPGHHEPQQGEPPPRRTGTIRHRRRTRISTRKHPLPEGETKTPATASAGKCTSATTVDCNATGATSPSPEEPQSLNSPTSAHVAEERRECLGSGRTSSELEADPNTLAPQAGWTNARRQQPQPLGKPGRTQQEARSPPHHPSQSDTIRGRRAKRSSMRLGSGGHRRRTEIARKTHGSSRNSDLSNQNRRRRRNTWRRVRNIRRRTRRRRGSLSSDRDVHLLTPSVLLHRERREILFLEHVHGSSCSLSALGSLMSQYATTKTRPWMLGIVHSDVVP
ncbi:uncharacterized protein [Procambarus clarkii]|uniref:uncharacterized protein n=1 Tax=Procambarus clarkii TaxID=6728 RepID=UPI00374259CD